MAEASYPFDGGSGSIITEQQWSNMSATWQDNGVIASDPGTMALKVTTLNQVGIVYVEPGEANVLGFHYENTASLPVAVPPNNTALTRIDLVVLQLDKNTNAVRVAHRTGSAASSPVPPTLVTTGGVYEIALAQIQMNPNTTQVPSTAPQLVDKRMFIGKRIQPREDIDELPIGAIGYKPSNGKFYGINGGGASELGAPPDLSGYATTAAVNTTLTGYSTTSHTHAGSGGVTPKIGVKDTNLTNQTLTALGVTYVRVNVSTTVVNIGGMVMTPVNAIQAQVGETYLMTGSVNATPSLKTALRVSLVGPGGLVQQCIVGDDTMSTTGMGFSLSTVFTAATTNPVYMEIRADVGAPNVTLNSARLTLHRIA